MIKIFNKPENKVEPAGYNMTLNEVVDEALASGAYIQGNRAIGLFIFPNEKYDKIMCEKLIARLDAFARKEGKVLNLKMIG